MVIGHTELPRQEKSYFGLEVKNFDTDTENGGLLQKHSTFSYNFTKKIGFDGSFGYVTFC